MCLADGTIIMTTQCTALKTGRERINGCSGRLKNSYANIALLINNSRTRLTSEGMETAWPKYNAKLISNSKRIGYTAAAAAADLIRMPISTLHQSASCTLIRGVSAPGCNGWEVEGGWGRQLSLKNTQQLTA
jgi:hypothetical protein